MYNICTMFTNLIVEIEMMLNNNRGIDEVFGGHRMEIVDVLKYTEFKKGAVFREVPIITNHAMATILLIDAGSMTKDLNHPQKDRIYYVIKGHGEVMIDNEIREVGEGELILIPKGKFHKYTTKSQRLTLMSINQIEDVVIKKKLMTTKMTKSVKKEVK